MLLSPKYRSWPPVLFLLVVGCSRPEPAEPVATVQVNLSNDSLPFPEWRTVGLTWHPTAPLDVDGQPSVFLHLLDGAGELVRTFDHPLPSPWEIGGDLQYEVEIYQSGLGAPLAPGEYELVLGLYGAGKQRWPLSIAGATERPRWEYSVARVEVPAVGADSPAFEFPAPWSPLEPGSDLQVLGRRWLSGNGAIEVENLEVPGTVKLRVAVPAGGSDAAGWEFRRGEEAPVLEVSSTCSGTVRSLEVPGTFEVVLPVFPAGEDLSCELRFLANYELVHGSTQERRTLALEILSWTAAQL
ncbi:MAG: hypothetical protein KDD47_03515 [Acidobacteria bacterium]|nr:hypothetical protein [Acidobacteriota bacterium]